MIKGIIDDDNFIYNASDTDITFIRSANSSPNMKPAAGQQSAPASPVNSSGQLLSSPNSSGFVSHSPTTAASTSLTPTSSASLPQVNKILIHEY